MFAHAPNGATAAGGAVFVSGMSFPVIRVVGSIWVNRRTSNEVRATVHSFLAQAEYLGEIAIGLSLALLARVTTMSSALTGAALVMIATTAVVRRHRTTSGPAHFRS